MRARTTIVVLVLIFIMPTRVSHGADSKDSAAMVRIPAGVFLMGSNNGPDDERPQHRLDIGAFAIDRAKVTQSQFVEFLNAVGSLGPKGEKYFDVDDNDAPDAARAHFRAGWNNFKPVGSSPKGASPFGMLDAAGNGWEWVISAYSPYPYNANDGREDLTRDDVRVTRAGGQNAGADEITTTHRGRHVSRNPRGGHHNISFRCAR